MKLKEYLSKIGDTTKALGVGTYAFRGQGNGHWPLHSAATRRLRKHRGEGVQNSPEFPSLYLDYHNSTLITPARTQGLGIELGRELSDLQLLAKLQHLRAATGLLDFSWNPLVGLWFASEEPELLVPADVVTRVFARIRTEAKQGDHRQLLLPVDDNYSCRSSGVTIRNADLNDRGAPIAVLCAIGP